MIRRSKYILLILVIVFSIEATGQQLVTKKILSAKVGVLIPSDFVLMDANTLRVKYPNQGNRPNEVYTNATASVNLAFTYTTKKATSDDLKKHAQELVNLLKGQNGITVISQMQEKVNDNDFLVIEFYSTAVNGRIYNKMFITVLEGRMLIGSFNCTTSVESLWKAKADQIIKSFKLF